MNIKHFVLPQKENQFLPVLLTKKAIVIYTLVILIVNIGFSLFTNEPVAAAISVDELYTLHNQEREKLGLKELAINDQLIESATLKAQAMLANNCWSHYCPDGKSPWDFFDQVNYAYVYAGENLAEGYSEDLTVMQAWMDSPTHRANIVKPEYDEIGIGYATGVFQGSSNNTIVVVHFGSRSVKSETTAIDNTPENPDIKITSPLNNIAVNNAFLKISGALSYNANQVNIYVDHKLNSTVKGAGKNFSYQLSTKLSEGEHKLQIEADNNFSKEISIAVDTISPSIDESSIQVKSVLINTKVVVIALKTIGDPVNVNITNVDAAFTRISTNNWEAEVPESFIKTTNSLVIETRDIAGNSSSKEINATPLRNSIANIAGSNQFTATAGISTAALQQTQQQLNTMFAGFLGVLTLLDFIILQKTGETRLPRSKSHLNFALIVILLIIVVFGASQGSILNGINN